MLLKTRFYIPPLRKQSVIRHQLIDKLRGSTGGQLILVSAPAGYGKTTIVSQWLHNNPHSFAWLTIDNSQSSPDVLWEYIINALQTTQPSLGEEAAKLLKNSPSTSLEPAIISLLNDLDELSTNNTAQDPITLILDDFHQVETPANLQLMNLFLDHLPPSIRIVLTSRVEPALALPRRRANNQILELTNNDLAFGLAEGRNFFNDTMGLSLDDDDINKLCLQSEGWAVGLQLAALSLQKNSATLLSIFDRKNINRHISDYLFDEVFSLQTTELKNFLIITSCAPRFCAGLCNQLIQKNTSLALITQIDKLNLFLVPLDNHRTWFRYHDLFRQFLLQHFSELPTQDKNQCYQLSALWFEESGYLEEALDQCILLQDWPNAARLLEQISVDKTQQGHGDSLLQWAEQIPTEFTQNLPLPTLTATPPSTATPKPITSNILTEPLTRREAQVMALVSKGLPNKHIASELNISLNTLKVHIRNLYGKMGVENRSQALIKIKNNPNT